MNIRVIEVQKPSVKKKKRRVAAYCCVSTDHSDQLESLETYPSNPPRPITKEQAHRLLAVSLNVYYISNGSKIVPAGFENNSVRYRSAFSPFACAVATIEYNAALRFAPFAVLLNSQFFRPTANGRIAFSARLLSIGTFPSFKNEYR